MPFPRTTGKPSRATALAVAVSALCFAASASAQSLPPLLTPPASPSIVIKAFTIEGENPLGGEKTQAVLQPFTGESTSIERLREAAKALEAALKEGGYGFYRVNLPPQTVTDTVRLKLILFTLGQVEIVGNQYFSTETIRADFPALVQGQSPNTQQLRRNVAMFNEQDGKQVTLTLTESGTRDAIDARLDIKDTQPSDFFVTLQNNGNDQTGKYRSTVGYQDSYFLGQDQSVSATYTTSPSQSADVQQYGVFWSAPLYGLASSLSAYAVYSDVNSGRVAGFFDVSGQGRFVGAKWTYHLLPLGDVSHALTLGLDAKQYVNRVVFGGQNTGVDVAAQPLTLSYAGKWHLLRGLVDWHAEYAANSPGGTGNDAASYTANRAGATPAWSVLRMNANANHEYASGWMAQARWSTQTADAPLIAGEQFGLGGAQTLRAYADREASGDLGQTLALELWSPVLGGNVRLVGFVETGAVTTHQPQGGQSAQSELSDLGVGLRWQFAKAASLSLDAAQALNDGSSTKAQDWRANLSVVVKF
jgi:hemolysin activation/secretion protein